MLDMSKAIVTVDASPETLAAFDRHVRYANATAVERRRMAAEEQREWDKQYMRDVLMPGDKPTLRFKLRSLWVYRIRPMLFQKRAR